MSRTRGGATRGHNVLRVNLTLGCGSDSTGHLASDASDRGVFIGDVLHHPLQCLRPEWSTFACTDMEGSRVSRTRLLDEHADSGTLMMPAHFPEPTAGWIRRHRNAYRFDFRE